MIIEKELLEFEKAINHIGAINKTVSESGVDWHIDHTLRVINQVCNALKYSEPKAYKRKFSLIKTYIFLRGSIPRGKARAPKSVVANNEITREGLEEQLRKAQIRLEEIEGLPLNSHFLHPYFGVLNLKETKKFLKIHTRHHLKIIDDIIKKSQN